MRSLLALLSSAQPRWWTAQPDAAVLEGGGHGQESLWKVCCSNWLPFVRIIKIMPLDAILPHEKTQILRKELPVLIYAIEHSGNIPRYNSKGLVAPTKRH